MFEPEPTFALVNWRSGGACCSESLWSVVHKVCWVNAIRGPGLLRHFADPRKGMIGFTSQQQSGGRQFVHDLRFYGQLDVPLLARSLRLPTAWQSACSFDGIDVPRMVRNWTVPFLRYCPTCLESGYHSILFQCVDQRSCPQHGDLLEDHCPKCGQRIPYSLPGAKVIPYSCECGRLLWWGIRSEAWQSGFKNRAAEHRFARNAEEHIASFRRIVMAGASKSALVWLRRRGPKETHWLYLLEGRGRGHNRIATEPVVLVREWGREFRSRLMPRAPTDSAYGAIPDDDEQLRERIYQVYQRVERQIYRSFPVTARRRWFAMTHELRSFKDIGTMPWSKEFLAYLLWKSYWLDTCYGSLPRGNKMIREAKSPYKPQLSKVYWRYLQHARRLRPAKFFTTADEWAHLHFFAIVAMATYRAALDLVYSVKLYCYPFKVNRCARLEAAILPFVALIPGHKNSWTYELKIWPSNNSYEHKHAERRKHELDRRASRLSRFLCS